jgi:hypothetical protein
MDPKRHCRSMLGGQKVVSEDGLNKERLAALRAQIYWLLAAQESPQGPPLLMQFCIKTATYLGLDVPC